MRYTSLTFTSILNSDLWWWLDFERLKSVDGYHELWPGRENAFFRYKCHNKVDSIAREAVICTSSICEYYTSPPLNCGKICAVYEVILPCLLHLLFVRNSKKFSYNFNIYQISCTISSHLHAIFNNKWSNEKPTTQNHDSIILSSFFSFSEQPYHLSSFLCRVKWKDSYKFEVAFLPILHRYNKLVWRKLKALHKVTDNR